MINEHFIIRAQENGKKRIFVPKRKLMESNYSFRLVMQRYGVADVSALKNFQQLNSLCLHPDFITAVVRLFEEDNTVQASEFDRFSTEVILDYIRKTHRFYLSKKLPEIEQSISLLLQDFNTEHPLLYMLSDFFSGYRKDLSSHIMKEEKLLLPYIDGLLKIEEKKVHLSEMFNITKHYSIDSFVDSHNDTEGDLAGVRSTILLYEPPKTNQSPYRILLSQLQAFERDLNVHAFIEDHVLLPRAEKLEKKCMLHMKEQGQLN